MIVTSKISLGELVDKISILIVKTKNITNEDKLNNINHELEVLMETLNSLNLESVNAYIDRLVEINQELWIIEDNIRKKEAKKEFDDEFIELARSVYTTNDKRFDVKTDINISYGSAIKEEKEYEEYK